LVALACSRSELREKVRRIEGRERLPRRYRRRPGGHSPAAVTVPAPAAHRAALEQGASGIPTDGELPDRSADVDFDACYNGLGSKMRGRTPSPSWVVYLDVPLWGACGAGARELTAEGSRDDSRDYPPDSFGTRRSVRRRDPGDRPPRSPRSAPTAPAGIPHPRLKHALHAAQRERADACADARGSRNSGPLQANEPRTSPHASTPWPRRPLHCSAPLGAPRTAPITRWRETPARPREHEPRRTVAPGASAPAQTRALGLEAEPAFATERDDAPRAASLRPHAPTRRWRRPASASRPRQSVAWRS